MRFRVKRTSSILALRIVSLVPRRVHRLTRTTWHLVVSRLISGLVRGFVGRLIGWLACGFIGRLFTGLVDGFVCGFIRRLVGGLFAGSGCRGLVAARSGR